MNYITFILNIVIVKELSVSILFIEYSDQPEGTLNQHEPKTAMRILLVIFFSLLTAGAAAPDLNVIFIVKPDPINAYERILMAVFHVECNGNLKAYNQLEEAKGPLQIRPIRLLDYNLRTGNKYLLDDCYDFNISKKIFMYYALKTGYPNYEVIAKNWNGSGKMTSDYWEKIKLEL